MKKFYAVVIALFAFTFSFAQTNTANQSGDWDDSKIWSKNHVPADGEIVEIPSNISVEVDDNYSLSNSDMDVRVFGKLVLKNGKLRIGDNSKITLFTTGSLISIKENNADQITIGGIEKYNGTFGTLYGPLVASKSTSGFQPVTYTVLPVKFTQFNVVAKNSHVVVQWATAEETGAAYFEVERSSNGTTWTTVGQVKAAGNTAQQTQYNYTDNYTVNGTIYYRIKQADVNGKANYTAIQTIRSGAMAQVNIVAAQNKVAVQFNQPVKGKVEVLIVNHAGQVINKQLIQNGAGQVVLNTTNLKGAHFVTISNGAGINASKQVVL